MVNKTPNGNTSEQPPVKSTMASQVDPPGQSSSFYFSSLSKLTLQSLIGAVQLGVGLLQQGRPELCLAVRVDVGKLS